MKRVLALLLCFATVLGLFAGCTGAPENTDYITKGEFFALFIQEHNLYSDVYTQEEIQNSTSYEIEANIMLEWALIDESQTGNLSDATTKELLAQSCVRFMSFRQEHNVKIKDIDKCNDPQAIMDAVGMGIFQLDNGYFDARERMTYDNCLSVFEKTNEIDRTTTFDNELDIEYQDNVYDISDVELVDVVFYDQQPDPAQELEAQAEDRSAITLATTSTGEEAISLSSNMAGGAEVKIAAFEYRARQYMYEVGCVLRYDPYTLTSGKPLTFGYTAFAGVIKEVRQEPPNVVLVLEDCPIEQLVKDTPGINNPATTKANAMPKEYTPEKDPDVKEGFDLKKTSSGTGIVATFKHTFTLEDKVYSKQTWRNATASPSITITATVDNFQVTSKNLGKMILGIADEGSIAVNFDSSITVKADSGGLRYSPANNGNGKMWSNLSNSRWTGASAGGSKSIKLGMVKIPLASSGFTIDCGVYLYIHMDGSLEVTVEQDHSYACSIKKGGKVAINNNSSKPRLAEAEMQINISAGLEVRPSISFWSKKIVDAKATAGLGLHTTAGIYAKETNEALAENVYATKAELAEDPTEYMYCIHTVVTFDVSGYLLTKDSVIGKFVIEKLGCKSPGIDKSWAIKTIHFEDGSFVDECTRGKNEKGEEVEAVNSEGKIYLSSYKENLTVGAEIAIGITSMPIKDEKILPFDGMSVVTGNPNVATATVQQSNKSLNIIAVGDGSTEITIKVKKKKDSKEYYTQTISVTVRDGQITETTITGDLISGEIILV